MVDIEAAKEGDLAVHDADLAVATRHAALEPGIEYAVMNTSFGQCLVKDHRLPVSRAQPVCDDIDIDAARGCADKCILDLLAGQVEREDIGLEIEFKARRVDGGNQRRKEVGTAM